MFVELLVSDFLKSLSQLGYKFKRDTSVFLLEFNGIHIQHWPFYCEENIWHLCQETFLLPFERKVIFISNKGRCFAMKHQRADSLIARDYRVVLLFYDSEWKDADL